MNTTINLAIENLENTSIALEKAACDPKHYNTDFAHYLDIMAYEMRKQASSLKEFDYLLGSHG